MNAVIHPPSFRLCLGLCFVTLITLGGRLPAQTSNPEQTLAAMDKCREQVISGLSFGDKMKMKAAMGAIQNNQEFLAANNAVKDARTPEAKIEARKSLSKVKLDLLVQEDPSLKPVVAKIRAAQNAVLK